MLSRHDLSGTDWNRIIDLILGRAGEHGGMGNDNRTFRVEAIAKNPLSMTSSCIRDAMLSYG